MAELGLQDAILLEQAADQNSELFADLMAKLLKPPHDDRSLVDRFRSKGEWRYLLPCKGDPEMESLLVERTPFHFAERAEYRNGIASLALVAAELVDLVVIASGRKRVTPTVCVSGEWRMVGETLESAGSVSTLVHYCGRRNLYEFFRSVRPETVIFDHTTVNVPVDELLGLAFQAGVRVVDGVFPYHAAAIHGWDITTGLAKWSYTHAGNWLTVGPDDDPSRLMKYRADQYLKFVKPSLWEGNARQYGYEIRKYANGLAVYRAVYLGDKAPLEKEELSFKLPMTSSQDMVLVTINRDLAAGVFASKSNNASELMGLKKDYAIEVRRDLFVSAVDFLISRDKGTDTVGEAIRYVTQHNYVDLVNGVQIVRQHSLQYADALCVAMVCALTAFTLRYKLTNESIPLLQRQKSTVEVLMGAPLGALGRLVWMMSNYVSDALSGAFKRTAERVKTLLLTTDYIPGVCYDVYMDMYYRPDLPWFQPDLVGVEVPEFTGDQSIDPFVDFLGEQERAYAPNVVAREPEKLLPSLEESKYVPNPVPDPAVVLQHVYDQAFPGSSVTQLQNVAELKRVRDVNLNTEFYGRIEVNKDIAAPERLHVDPPVRTAALPLSRTPLLDAIMASAKRNFNPPDLQMQNDPWEFARSLVDEFVDWAFVPGFRDTIGKAYKKDPITFNVTDYMAWRATRDGAYRSALEAECPAELVELQLEKFDTIVKQRIKPKLSVSAQHELAQPQVIVSLSKKDTALFTSVFRVVFERFDGALRSELKSAGRSSDEDISQWLTRYWDRISALAGIEMDSSKYDKSQNLLARMVESLLFEELGLDPVVNEIFSDSYVGKVSSKSLGLMFHSSYQMKSGAPDTMLGNLVYNMVSAMKCIGKSNIKFMIAKGDDNVLWVTSSKSLELGVSKMSGLFNLETKLIAGQVLYFSSGYFVPTAFGVWFAPDPLKMIELTGEIFPQTDTLRERYVSFCDRVKSFTRHYDIPRVLQRLVCIRHQVSPIDITMAIDAFCAMAASFETYVSVLPSPSRT